MQQPFAFNTNFLRCVLCLLLESVIYLLTGVFVMVSFIHIFRPKLLHHFGLVFPSNVGITELLRYVNQQRNHRKYVMDLKILTTKIT